MNPGHHCPSKLKYSSCDGKVTAILLCCVVYETPTSNIYNCMHHNAAPPKIDTVSFDSDVSEGHCSIRQSDWH